jgi:hypothetical protein
VIVLSDEYVAELNARRNATSQPDWMVFVYNLQSGECTREWVICAETEDVYYDHCYIAGPVGKQKYIVTIRQHCVSKIMHVALWDYRSGKCVYTQVVNAQDLIDKLLLLSTGDIWLKCDAFYQRKFFYPYFQLKITPSALARLSVRNEENATNTSTQEVPPTTTAPSAAPTPNQSQEVWQFLDCHFRCDSKHECAMCELSGGRIAITCTGWCFHFLVVRFVFVYMVVWCHGTGLAFHIASGTMGGRKVVCVGFDLDH